MTPYQKFLARWGPTFNFIAIVCWTLSEVCGADGLFHRFMLLAGPFLGYVLCYTRSTKVLVSLAQMLEESKAREAALENARVKLIAIVRHDTGLAILAYLCAECAERELAELGDRVLEVVSIDPPSAQHTHAN